MRIESILKLSMIFLLGFLSANILGYYLVYGTELPVLKDFGFSSSVNNPAPFDFVKENNIEVYPNKVVINVKGASISRYAASGSMRPVLDKDSNGIRIKPESENDIHIGDIITFEQDNNLIVHRVISIGTDSEGFYFITRGDNNPVNDGKVRFKDIKYLTIALIY